MDRKAVIVLIISFALLMLWPAMINRYFPPTPLPQTNTVSSLTNRVGTNIAAPTTLPQTQGGTPAEATLTRAPASAPRQDVPEQTLVLEDEHTRYTFTSHGGGVKLVELKQYLAAIECRRKGAASTNQLATLNTRALTPALALPGLDGGGAFALTRIANGVRAEKPLPNGLHLINEFHLSTNFLLNTTVRLENRSAQPAELPPQEWVVGTSSPIGLHDETLHLGLEWYDGSSSKRIDETWFANRTLGCIPGVPRQEYLAGASNVAWAAVHNQFFAMIAVPETPALQVTGRRVLLPPPTSEEIAKDPRVVRQPFGYQTALVYPATVLPAGQALERRFTVYAGPKKYLTLSQLPKNQDLVMGFGGFFGPFAKALLLSMNAIHKVIPSYGMAIIVITVIIKLLFWPLTQASTRSMKRMAELQPQMKALQEKYKDDPAKMNKKLMEFMKENKVSPLGGCLPLLLQIPVFFGFYKMLQSAIELRGESFLWACDLSQADTVWVIPGLDFPVNPMPLLMGVTMFWQAHLTPPSPGMDPVQQKIMKYMPLMFMVFLYSFSAGLTLYWTVQNLLTIAQMKLTKSKDPHADKAAPAPQKPAAPRKKS